MVVSGSFCINLLEEFITTQNKMIAAKIFIANGSNSALHASSITARFVKMHRTSFPRIPSGLEPFPNSYWYGHDRLSDEWCSPASHRFMPYLKNHQLTAANVLAAGEYASASEESSSLRETSFAPSTRAQNVCTRNV